MSRTFTNAELADFAHEQFAAGYDRGKQHGAKVERDRILAIVQRMHPGLVNWRGAVEAAVREETP